MSRTRQGYKTYERKARNAIGYDGTKEKFMSEAPEYLEENEYSEK